MNKPEMKAKNAKLDDFLYSPCTNLPDKMAELKKLLKERGLSTTGNKSNLLERLSNAGDTSLESSDKELLEDDSVLDDTTDLIAAEDTDTEPTVVTEFEPSISVTLSNPVKTVSAKPTSTSTQPVKIQSMTQPPSSTGMAARLKRFGVVSEQARKAARVERFQSSDSSSSTVVNIKQKSSSSSTGGDVLKKRAERFSTPVSATSATFVSQPGSDVDIMKKRAERFGEVTSSKLGKADEHDRVMKRKARFGTLTALPDSAASAEQKKRRLERFGSAVAV